MDYENVRQQTKAAVEARPFTRVTGKPTYEQKEKFIEEAEELAMAFTVSYTWSGAHGLLAEVMGARKYLAETGKHYVPPVRPPVYDPTITTNGMTQAAIRVAQAINDTAKGDYAVLEGFREGFGDNFRKAFDKKYYEQLWEKTFKYKRVTPYTYINHLEAKHVKMDTLVIKRLRAEALRTWDGEEHISTFATRLTREQERLAALSPPITISDEEKLQTYMEAMWSRTDIFDELFMMEWTNRPHAQQTWAHATAYFEAKVQAIENFHAAGGQSNQYASANAATEIKDAVAAALDEFASQNKENAMAVSEVKEVREKLTPSKKRWRY